MDAKLRSSGVTEETYELLIRLMNGVSVQAFAALGDRVRAGPFVGMRIPQETPWGDGNSCAKLLGCYEHELHEAINFAIWRNPQVVVNVGCAEGYYAIGFARLGGATVYGLDIDKESLELCSAYAEKNSVQVDVREGANVPEELRLLSAPKGHRLYIIDCEGAEVDLIDLDRCPELVHSDLIVECHDFMEFGASRRVADHLATTHRVELIRPRLPDFDRFLPFGATALVSVLMAVEVRPMPSYWLACWANVKGA